MEAPGTALSQRGWSLIAEFLLYASKTALTHQNDTCVPTTRFHTYTFYGS